MRLRQERMLRWSDRVSRWRDRAEELRTVADTVKNDQARMLLLDAAETYEKMVEGAKTPHPPEPG